MTAAASFLEAIHADFADDTPRVVFADWLDEHGPAHGIADAADRAAFLRAGVELGKVDPRAVAHSEPWASFRRCERDILARHPEWKRCQCPACKGSGDERGFEHQASFRRCPVCGGTGDLLRRRIPVTDGYVTTFRRPEPARGLLVVGATVAEIAGFGDALDIGGIYDRVHVPSPWLANLPLWYAVEVEGVEPFSTEGSCRGERVWVWPLGTTSPQWLDIPELWEQFPTPAAAKAALTAAVNGWRVRCLAKAKAAAYT